METREKSSPDWVETRCRYEQEPHTLRGLSALIGVSHTSIAKRAKRDRWEKYDPKNAPCKPSRKPDCKSGLQVTEKKQRAIAAAIEELEGNAESQFHTDLAFCCAMSSLEASPDATAAALELKRSEFSERFGPALKEWRWRGNL